MLKITQCADPQMWYAKFVGDYLPFVRDDQDGYWSREPDGYLNLIRHEDAEVVEHECK